MSALQINRASTLASRLRHIKRESQSLKHQGAEQLWLQFELHTGWWPEHGGTCPSAGMGTKMGLVRSAWLCQYHGLPEKFGDLTTADHKVPNEGGESRNNHRCAVVVQDLATQWIQCHPCKAKTSLETEKSYESFLSRQQSQNNLFCQFIGIW